MIAGMRDQKKLGQSRSVFGLSHFFFGPPVAGYSKSGEDFQTVFSMTQYPENTSPPTEQQSSSRNKTTYKTVQLDLSPNLVYEVRSGIMSDPKDSKDSAFGILGSSRLNTADGKNPPTSSATTSTQPSAGVGQRNSEEYRKACRSAHDALEDKLRDEERERKWTGRW